MSRFEDEHSGATEEDVMDSLNDDIEELTAQLAAERAAREKAEARVKVLEELAAALDDLLCAYRVGGQEWGARAADRVRRARAEKRIIAARAALRGEEQGK
jgi:hypothetical protein